MRRLQQQYGNNAIQRAVRTTIQAWSTIGRPDDRYEREAERVSETVMRSPERSATTGVSETARQETNAESTGVEGDVSRRIRSGRSGGKPLPDAARSSFESRFGRDFSDVRVHTGDRADEAARSINAEAFTMGTDIVFAKGNYSPQTTEGKKLLAHELTHVVQQEGAGSPPAIQRQEAPGSDLASAGTDTEGVSDEASSIVSFLTDVETVLGTGANLMELTGAISTGAFAAGAGYVSMFVTGMLSWADALQAQERWAAVQGTAYAVVSIANGRSPPDSHDDFGDGKSAWTDAAKKVQASYKQRLEDGDAEALESLYAARQQPPEKALNVLYQQLVDDHLEQKFLGFIPAGGNLHNIAKSAYLFWPGPDQLLGVSEAQREQALSRLDDD